jgi:hypothetical protein
MLTWLRSRSRRASQLHEPEGPPDRKFLWEAAGKTDSTRTRRLQPCQLKDEESRYDYVLPPSFNQHINLTTCTQIAASTPYTSTPNLNDPCRHHHTRNLPRRRPPFPSQRHNSSSIPISFSTPPNPNTTAMQTPIVDPLYHSSRLYNPGPLSRHHNFCVSAVRRSRAHQPPPKSPGHPRSIWEFGE